MFSITLSRIMSDNQFSDALHVINKTETAKVDTYKRLNRKGKFTKWEIICAEKDGKNTKSAQSDVINALKAVGFNVSTK